ncbi:MAG: sensor histidine kinase [Cyclobacteriaceae bacterium]
MSTTIRMLINTVLLLCLNALFCTRSLADSTAIDSLRQELEKTHTTNARIDILNELAYSLLDIDPVEAYERGAEAYQISTQNKDTTRISTSLVRMGVAKIKTGEYEAATNHMEESLALELALQHDYGIARAQSFLCETYGKLGMTAEAVEACGNGIDRFIKLDQPIFTSSTLLNLYNVHLEAGNQRKALETLHAKEAADSLHTSRPTKLNTTTLFASYYKETGNYTLSLKKYKEAANGWVEENDSSQLGNIYNEIGTIYRSIKQPDSARYYYLLSLGIKQKYNQLFTYAENYNNLAILYNDQMKYDSAAYYYHESLAISQETGDADALSRTYYNLGNNFKDQQAYDSAKIYYKRAEALTPSGDLLWNTYSNLYEVYYYFGQYDSADLYREKHIAVRDSLDHIAREAVRLKNNYEREQLKTASMQLDLQRREAEILKKNMTVTTLIISLLLLAVIFFAILKYYQQRKRAQIAAKDAEINKQKVDQLLKTAENKEMSAILRGQETERKRIAQDLHDRLGSMLAMIKIHFKTVEDNLESIKEENKQQYRKANTLLDEACEEVRKISHDMSSGVLQKFGLISALNNLKDSVNGTGQLKINLLAFGMEDERLDYRKEINIYRIIQELLSNTLKHAKAREMTIQLLRNEQNLNLLVEDDGIGFDPGRHDPEGMGLNNVSTRVKSLKGKMEIDSGKGSGTTVSIDIPLDE